MADGSRDINSVATLRNVMAMMALVERVTSRRTNLPGMAVFYGPSGYGKTTAATFTANSFNAYNVQAQSTWTKKSFCETLMIELGLDPEKMRVDQMTRAISREIAASDRPLIIDEVDHLVARGLIEIVRDIYEASDASIILIGEEDLPRKLMRWERVHGRIVAWVAAEPGVMGDLNQLAQIYCSGVSISDGLKDRLLAESHHSIRRICVNLDDVRLFAVARGLSVVDEAAWGDRSFFTGMPPKSRVFK